MDLADSPQRTPRTAIPLREGLSALRVQHGPTSSRWTAPKVGASHRLRARAASNEDQAG
jgi:hypothetical protein